MAKTSPIPNIDLGARFLVIDISGPKPRWKEVGRGYATRKTAQSLATKLCLPGVWMVDDLGYREYISAK